jgi:hypothetical protein
MWILVNLAMLVMATLVAGAAAVAVYWLLLRATVELMRPAAASVPVQTGNHLVPTTQGVQKGASKC